MVKQEYTNTRDLTYSRWHRTLPDKCYCMDLDWIEWRSGRGIIAVIETKDYRARGISNFQKNIMLDIATAIGVPAIFVKFNFDVNPPTFLLEHLQSGKRKNMTEEQYRKWLIDL